MEQIDVLERLGTYYLILLISDKAGWFLSHAEIKNLRLEPKTACWSEGSDNDYKINPSLLNEFISPEDLLRKMES